MKDPGTDIEAVLAESGPDYDSFSFERPSVGHQGDVYFVEVEYDGEPYEVVVKFQTGDGKGFALEPCLHDYVADRTDVPVPRILVYTDDPDLDVPPYFVTERIQGENLAEAMNQLDPDCRERVMEQAGRILGNMHDEIGFEGFGRLGLDGGSERLVVQELSWDWQQFFREMVDDYVDRLADTPFENLQATARDHANSAIDEVEPTGVPRLVHNDFRPANLLFDRTADEPITAVLDWQFALAGDPLYHLARTDFLFIDPLSRDTATLERMRERLHAGYCEYRDFEPDEQYRRVRPVYFFATLLWRMVGFDSAFADFSGLAKARIEAQLRRQFEQLVDDLPEES